MLEDLKSRMPGSTAKDIAYAVSTAISEGSITPGEKLPPIRTAAVTFGVAPATVSAAWALLIRAGLIHTDGRRGTLVRPRDVGGPARYRRALVRDRPFRLDLSTGVPDPELLPDLRSSMMRVGKLRTLDSYLDDPVLPGLVTALQSDWPYRCESFAILDGAMDALDLIATTHLRFGDRVAIEQPAFPPLLDLLDVLGVQVIGVDLDDQGPSPVALQAALAVGVRAFFFQPRAQNPTAVSLAAGRAEALATVLAGHDVLVVEDDSAGIVASTELISLGAWIPEQTLHIRSFSKSHGPDLRLAAVSGPAALLDPLVERRFLGQGWSSRLLQAILLDLLTDAAGRDQVARARAEYARRTAAVADALTARGLEIPHRDGLNLWIPVADEAAALLHLAAHGIGAAAGSPFWISVDTAPHIRITTAQVSSDFEALADVVISAARAASWGGPR